MFVMKGMEGYQMLLTGSKNIVPGQTRLHLATECCHLVPWGSYLVSQIHIINKDVHMTQIKGKLLITFGQKVIK